MREIRNILACRPPSEPDGALESFASGLARAHDADLHVVDLPTPVTEPDIGPAVAGGTGASTGPGGGDVARLLREYATSVPVDLVVVRRPLPGADGAPGSGTAADALGGAGVPVLTLPGPGTGPASTEGISTVLVPADLSDPSDPALDAGRQLAARLSVGLLLLDVTGLGTWLGGLEGLRGVEPLPVPAEEVAELGDVRAISDRARTRLQERLVRSAGGRGGRRPAGAVEDGIADGVGLLLGFIRKADGCLTVVSRDGLQSLRRPFGPSVADVIVQRAPCPVLMVESGRAAAPVSLSIRKSA